MKKTILLAIVFVGVLVLSVGYSDSRYRTAIGRTVPSVVLPSASGDVDLDALRGHYVLLNFGNRPTLPRAGASTIIRHGCAATRPATSVLCLSTSMRHRRCSVRYLAATA